MPKTPSLTLIRKDYSKVTCGYDDLVLSCEILGDRIFLLLLCRKCATSNRGRSNPKIEKLEDSCTFVHSILGRIIFDLKY